jgi:ribonuclease E
MANKMLVDAAHPEETRVVVLRGNRVEEFDFETAQRKQLRGNIYLAKVTRVEPSLQAAFVEYGGNRHGFLAFSEIHPDYYQIPVADRQALIDADERAQRDYDSEEDERGGRGHGRRRGRDARRRRDRDDMVRSEPLGSEEHPAAEGMAGEAAEIPAGENAVGDPLPEMPSDAQPQFDSAPESHPHEPAHEAASAPTTEPAHPQEPVIAEAANPPVPAEIGTDAVAAGEQPHDTPPDETHSAEAHVSAPTEDGSSPSAVHDENGSGAEEEEEVVESVGGADAMEEVPDRAPRYRRPYKIQEVIKRRQVMLVQVVKEERGTKGAALTTYLSLAGRYCVLMPNTARGGGISRKITSAEDRKKLREIAEELDVPEGMGVILRTAGAARTKAEVKRDFEYLLRLWEQVRDLTLKSSAPTLVYEEGSLAKRSIRDLYTKDIEEIVVAGEAGYRDAKEFMRMLMPSHAKNVKHYADSQPIFTRYGIESQLDAMFSPTVQLRSGGYVVINQTEALVSIDVNSGRSTREHHIEDTALKTNCEAAEEIARQLRLRDLAGLIVIDFIDMDEKRNNRTVERRMKDALRNDRARIQVGRISHFGLLEMSRQRIRTSVLESSTEKCPHCGGTGHMRSVSSVALQLLRSLEETLLKGATHNQVVRTRPEIAQYVLNHKRAHLMALEDRFRVAISVNSDPLVGGQPGFSIERGEQVMSVEQAKAIAAQALAIAPPQLVEEEEPDTVFDEEIEDTSEEAPEHAVHTGQAEEARDFGGDEQRPSGDREGRGRRRRRRRGGRGGERREHGQHGHGEHPQLTAEPGEPAGGEMTARHGPSEFAPGGAAVEGGFASQHGDQDGNGEPRRRRRGRRGGRRNRRNRDDAGGYHPGNGGEQPYAEFQGGDASPQEVGHADSGPRHDPAFAPASEPSYAPQPEPAAAPPALPAEPAAPPEPPRRRSTVREPAPVLGLSGSADVAPPPSPPRAEPTPVITESSAGDDASKPRRTGWWAKRLMGDKS